MKASHLAEILLGREEWLCQRILAYSRAHGFSNYTSSLAEAWRASIAGLSAALVEAASADPAPAEFSPAAGAGPGTAFGVLEAGRHRQRGVPIGMFLALMKYYRESFLELAILSELGSEDAEAYRLFVTRFFDAVEIAFVGEWDRSSSTGDAEALRETTRAAVNEKNRLLTAFESLPVPALILDDRSRLVLVNHSAEGLLLGDARPGGTYYGGQPVAEVLPGFLEQVGPLLGGDRPEATAELTVPSPRGPRRVKLTLGRMLDVSGKFDGTVVTVEDLEVRDSSEARLRVATGMLRRLAEGAAQVPVALRPIVDRAAFEAEGAIAKAVAVRNEVPEDVCPRADPEALQQVLRELVTNAAEATQAGPHPGAPVHVRASPWPAGRVTIEVCDLGGGIPEALRVRLFAGGFTTHPGTAGGFGLVLAARLVRAMGGAIAVRSTAGDGTCVSVELPGPA